MKSLLLIVILFLINNLGYAHMCHDPFRPRDRLVLIPDKEIIRIEETGEFRMYIENTFRSILSNVRLNIESQAFNIEVRPQLIERLMPGERSFFLVRLKLRKGFKPETYPLRISVDAKSAELKPSRERIEIVVEDRRIEHKLEPEIEPKEQERIEILPQKKSEPEVRELPKPTEDVQQEAGEVAVRVEKIPFWQRPYFYIILILFLIVILIWRKLK